jgi:DtxR family transcriptional regulator, Mn-dependent transcriptional regulator
VTQVGEDRPLTAAVQDYLREIYKLEEDGRRAATSRVAEMMGVSTASVSTMLKRLATLELVEHTAYRGVVLTDAGRRVALEITRHHRLLEQYLAETLGVPLDQVHAEADRLEHALSELVEERIDLALGRPTHDPHGHPIPTPQLELGSMQKRTLADLAPGERATVRAVPDDDADLLRYLDELLLVPGCKIELVALAPFGGPVTLRSRAGDHAISRQLAAAIHVA